MGQAWILFRNKTLLIECIILKMEGTLKNKLRQYLDKLFDNFEYCSTRDIIQLVYEPSVSDSDSSSSTSSQVQKSAMLACYANISD